MKPTDFLLFAALLLVALSVAFWAVNHPEARTIKIDPRIAAHPLPEHDRSKLAELTARTIGGAHELLFCEPYAFTAITDTSTRRTVILIRWDMLIPNRRNTALTAWNDLPESAPLDYFRDRYAPKIVAEDRDIREAP